MRQKLLLTLLIATLIAIAGCSEPIGADEENETVIREDDNITVSNLTVFSEGKRDCYHTLEASVTNTNNYTVENLDILITISNENDQVLSEFETGYTEVQPNEQKELQVEHGPQKNQCWYSGDATNYTVQANYTAVTE